MKQKRGKMCMKQKKIWIIGIIVVIILLAIGVGVGVWIYESKYQYEIEEVTKYQYNLLYVDEKYGVIDENGNILIEPIYDIIQIPNPSKPVFICMKDYQADKREYQVEVLNEKKEQIFQEFERVEAISLKEENSTVPYEKSVLKFKQNGLYGIMDYQGNILVEAQYDEIQGFPYKEGILKILKNGKYGVMNIKGTILIDTIYDSISFDGYYNEETGYEKSGFLVSKIEAEKELYGYHNERGKKILDVQYDEINRITETEETKHALLIVWKDGKAGIYQDKSQKTQEIYDGIDYDRQSGLYIVTKDGKQGVMNENGKEILPAEQDSIFISGEYISAQNGDEVIRYDRTGEKVEDQSILAVWKTDHEDYQITMDTNEKYGIRNKNGDTLVKNKYDSLEYLYQDYFIAMDENQRVGVIKTDGKSVIELKYNLITRIENSQLIKAVRTEERQIDLYDEQMNFISSFQGEELKVEEVNGYLRIYTTGTAVEYYTKAGKKVDSKEVYPNAKLIAKEKDGKWGYTDREGNLKVDYQYDQVTELNEYGFAGIKLGNKWGVINQEGQVVQEPIYEIEEEIPEFLGKYYRVLSLISQPYYTDYHEEETVEE